MSKHLEPTSSAAPSPRGLRDGWSWLVLEIASRGYLVGLLTLVACALLPTLLGWQGYVIRSDSMQPKVSVGDVVLTASLDEELPVPVGRVVSFERPAEATASGHADVVMHRIVAANEDGTFVTAGDANRDVDSTPIERDEITGQGRLLIPWVGLPGFWIESRSYAQLGAWSVLTLLAVVIVAASRPRRTSSSPAGGLDATAGASPPRKTKRRVAAAAGLSCGALLLGPWANPIGTAEAAFSDRTINAGNSWSVAVGAPKITSELRVNSAPSTDDWYRSASVDVNITARASGGAQVRSVSYRVNNGSLVTVQNLSANFVLSTQGDNTITYFATDVNGTRESVRSARVRLDNKAPVLTVTSRVGSMNHNQWMRACSGLEGGVCGDVTDTGGSGVGSVQYVFSRAIDGRCFNGSAWVTDCSKRTPATLNGTRWAASIPDSRLGRSRDYYTITVYATDVAGNSTNTTSNFSVG